jgi:plastocyanin
MALRAAARALVCLVMLAVPLAMGADAVARTVTIQNFAFAPATLTINVGDTVTWQNADSTTHSATSNVPGQFDTGFLAPGAASRPIPFALAGTFAYHCAVHPTMLGTIIVLAAATPAPTPTPRPPTPPATLPPTPPPATAAPTAPPTPAPTTAAPTASPSPTPEPTPTASPSPSPTTAPTAAGTPISIPTSLAIASPSATGGARELGNGPGPLIAVGGAAIVVLLGGVALYLYRRR